MPNKDGVVSIGFDYKKELEKMIKEFESEMNSVSSNANLSKGVKTQFDNILAEMHKFKADIDKELSTLGSGKVTQSSFKSFKQTVENKFKDIREDIDRLDLAVSTLNDTMGVLGNGINLSKISNEFKAIEDYVKRTNDAVENLVGTLGEQGISLFSFDNRNVIEFKDTVKQIEKALKSLDTDVGEKFELFDEDEAQSELNRLSVQLVSTLELMENAKQQMTSMGSSTDGFKKARADFASFRLQAASLNEIIETLYETTESKGIYIEMDDNSLSMYEKYTDDLSDNLESIISYAQNAKKELSSLLDIQKAASVKVSSQMNPNSAEFAATVTIETTSSELWKILDPIMNDLQNILNSKPVVAPVKLVVAPTSVSAKETGNLSVSPTYSKKYQKVLAETGKDAVIDLEGVYKKTFTSIMDEAVSYAKETIGKIQGIFENSPIKLHFDFNEEEFKTLSNALLSGESDKKIDLTGEVSKVKKEVDSLATSLEKVEEILSTTDDKKVSFKGFDKFAEDINKSLSALTELQDMLKALQNIETTLAKAVGINSVTEIESQWENVSKLISNAVKLDGTFRKNANVNKLASEYSKYLDMGGSNQLSDISKIKENGEIISSILSKVKELNNQKIDNTSVDKADAELKSVSSTLDDVISRLDHMINLTRDIGNTFYKMFKDASVSDIDKQWSSIESKFSSIADESGKINLAKQKKDIQELMEMYQKYINTGGMKSPFDLTDNTETIRKLNKVYEQLNTSKENKSSVSKESKNFDVVKESVDSLTSAINVKIEAIKTEANTMELAARAEVKSIQKIIEALNPLIEKIQGIPELKIPKETDIISSNESNVSSGNVVKAADQEVKSAEKVTKEYEKQIEAEKKKAEIKQKAQAKEKQSNVDSALKQQESAWKNIQSIREKISKVDPSNKKYIAQLQDTKKFYQEQYIEVGKVLKANQDLYDSELQVNKLKQIQLETTAKISKYETDKNIAKKSSLLNNLNTYDNSAKYTSDFISRVQVLKNDLSGIDITKPKDVARLTKIESSINSIISDSKLLENKLVKQDSKIADIISKMKIFRDTNTNMSSSQKSEINSLINYAETLENSGKVTADAIEEVKTGFSRLKAEVVETGKTGLNFIDQIVQRTKDINSKFFAQYFSIQDWIRYIEQGIETIKELNTAMVEVRKVSDETEASYANFQKTIASTAKEIASTNAELLNSSADYLRLGYNLEESAKLAENTALFVNVGDGVDIEEATEDIITAMKAFNIEAEDSMKIVDSYNQIGNLYALSASDIGEAMKRSASALETANNSFEESIGLITAMNEIVQDAETTGTSLKVMSLRMRGAKADLESMGESTDDLAESTSKMREEIKALTGVDIMIDDNTFKSTAQQIKELGAVWDTLTDTSQAAVLEKVAGKSRANAIAALIQNYEKIDEVIADLEDAEGSALKENEAIVDSIEGRIKILSATVEEFWQSFKADNTIKGTISIATDLLGVVTDIVDTVGVLGTISIGAGAFAGFKNVGRLEMQSLIVLNCRQ